ncbi:MAG: GGDEF domain-containing protein [Armatimonadetes bacterium]|nr:GGDEF domain-containing protein [Armatimonadota bacterium]
MPFVRWFRKLGGRRKLFPSGLESIVLESRVPALLQEGQWVGMIYLDIADFQLTEQVCGPISCLRVLQSLDSLARKKSAQLLKPYLLLETRRWGDDLLIYFYSPALPPPALSDLAELANQTKDQLARELNAQCAHLLPGAVTFHVGYNILRQENSGNGEKVLYTAFKEAMLIAKSHLDAREVERRRQFEALLATQNIRIVYQPVADLNTGEVLGFEALSRGPADTFFASPLNLFSYAEKTNQLYSLEKIAREKALAGLAELLTDKKLFLNISPQVVNDPAFRPEETREFLAGLGANPNQVVFELTERTSIDDFSAFRRSLEHYRQNGFLIAIDDAGAGYSSLQAIAEIQPDYIKVDHSLIRDIEKIATKRMLVETFQTFAQKTNSLLIAEGIETEAELACLKKIGIPLGQGYYLARPDYPPPAVEERAIKSLKRLGVSYQPAASGRTAPVGTIVQALPPVSAATLTREVLDYFTAYPQIEGLALVEKDQHPVGLIMRDKLFNQLGTQFGFAIYTERPISLVMDAQPLILEADTPIEMVSQAAMGRLDHKIYDSIIITRNRKYHGLVSIRALLDALTSMQIEAARFANPLTGLPGNRQIEEELLNRLSGSRPFSVIYADLDNFKGFNDRYGFERGDQAIKLTAEIIAGTVREHGAAGDLTGHVGGDDFVVITLPEAAETICQKICAAFDLAIGRLYDPEDREKGCILTRDREDREVVIPLMSISLALINCAPGEFTGPEELARIAAELKKYAKSQPGSVYVKERRKRGMAV